mgnify:FL=1
MRSVYASNPTISIGRLFKEKPASLRNEYQRDRDRIIHCSAFRRLEYKTQVFVNHEGDMFRTRLTHSIEVSQIARSIARILGGHEDLAETISLAHDLGHTPFGHAGQDALNKCMKKYGGFEHNLQSLRIVDNLEKRYADFNGLNLMFESREGILKHCSLKNAKKLGTIGERFIKKEQPSIEAQIVNIADEIAYINHDIDDGFRSGLLSIETLMTNVLFKLCADDVYASFPKINDEIFINEVVRRMINLMVSDLITTSTENIQKLNPSSTEEVRAIPSLVKFSSELFKSKQEIKAYLRKSLYEHQQVKDMTNNAQHIINTLFDYFMDDPSRIPIDFKKDTADEFERTVSDYIAGMTDRFAIQLHTNLR